MSGNIRTVRGDIPGEQLGRTMVHEHFLWDQTCWYRGDPEDPFLRDLNHQKLTMENRGLIYYHCHQNLDNIVNLDLELAIEEARHFKRAGGGAMIDVTPIGIGRDPKAVLAISEATGLHMLMGTGYYVAEAHPDYLESMGADAIAGVMIRELTVGVDGTGLCAGVIGEIGFSSSAFDPAELKVIRAAVIAQREVGAAIYLHPPRKRMELLDIMEQDGALMDKVVVGHINPTMDTPDYLDSLAKRGAYLAYDQFGHDIPLYDSYFIDRDIDRIRSIKTQIELGNLSRILVSQDTCFKMDFLKYGGFGYAHILRDLPPFFRHEGVSREEMEAILTDNPAEAFGI